MRCEFEDSLHGYAAMLLLRQITEFQKLTLAAEELAGDRVAARTYQLTRQNAAPFHMRVRYASTVPLAGLPVGRVLSQVPLPALLSGALLTLEADYEEARAGNPEAPSIAVWANCLRPLSGQGLDQRDFGPASILATRAERVVIRDLAAQGLLDVLPSRGRGKGRYLELTNAGHAAQELGSKLLNRGAAAWRQRFSGAHVSTLLGCLATVLEGVAIQLPHHFTGYGPGDAGVTGGSYVAADPGPPEIPAHGSEWPVVLRTAGVAAELPESALLSQTLTAFSIDYHAARLGALGEAVGLLQHVPDEGLDLVSARRIGGMSGTTRSTPERHLVAVAEPAKGKKQRKVFLSPKGRRFRDAYPALVQQTEAAWIERHGTATVAALRTALEAMAAGFETGVPEYPDATLWFRELHSRNP